MQIFFKYYNAHYFEYFEYFEYFAPCQVYWIVVFNIRNLINNNQLHLCAKKEFFRCLKAKTVLSLIFFFFLLILHIQV